MRETSPSFVSQTLLLGGIVVVTGIFWQLSRRLMMAIAMRPEAVSLPLSFWAVLGLLALGSAAWAGLGTKSGQHALLRTLAGLTDAGALLALAAGWWQWQQQLQPPAEGEASPLVLPMLLLLMGSFGLLLLGTLGSLLWLTQDPSHKTYAPWFRHFLGLLWLYLMLFCWLNL